MKPGFARTAWRVAREEWRALRRSQAAVAAALLLLVLTLAAIFVSLERAHAVQAERTRFQHSADEQWNSQPDRHPHRVVHYGHYVFRPLTALAFFDFGVAPFTGSTLYLEGHRQNSANFSDAGQSSLLLRFGQLTPAFVLQVLAPLLLVFLAFGALARERERGQLRLMLAHGVSGGALVAGKLAAHGVLAIALAAPALLALAAIGAAEPELGASAAWLAAGYAAYLLLWSFAAVLLSALVRKARDALLLLVAAWALAAVLLPRMLPDLAAGMVPRPTRIEMEAAIHAELARIGDSHNPDDPYFKSFRESVLQRYGVNRIEDLPVNYKGLVIEEGERLTSELFLASMQRDFALQSAQARVLDGAALAVPLLALRSMSAALADTDRSAHERFLLAGEDYRYRLIQALNRLHAEKVKYHDDRAQRLSADYWRGLPRYRHPPAALERTVTQRVLPALAILAAWLAAALLAAAWAARRLERNT
ncbi:MAG: transporter permease [Pseudoduganella sp.]|jgi:ABC-2 type transport system permease protein|nr:transporter permease [Pseudoduganella sp.]